MKTVFCLLALVVIWIEMLWGTACTRFPENHRSRHLFFFQILLVIGVVLLFGGMAGMWEFGQARRIFEPAGTLDPWESSIEQLFFKAARTLAFIGFPLIVIAALRLFSLPPKQQSTSGPYVVKDGGKHAHT